jgi:hypothetical protein
VERKEDKTNLKSWKEVEYGRCCFFSDFVEHTTTIGMMKMRPTAFLVSKLVTL